MESNSLLNETYGPPDNTFLRRVVVIDDERTTVSPTSGKSRNSIHSRNWREKKKEQPEFMEKEKIRKRNERKNMTPEQRERSREQNRKRQQNWRERQKLLKHENGDYQRSEGKRQKCESATTPNNTENSSTETGYTENGDTEIGDTEHGDAEHGDTENGDLGGDSENGDFVCLENLPDLDLLEELDTSEILKNNHDFDDLLADVSPIIQYNSECLSETDGYTGDLISSMELFHLSDEVVPTNDSNIKTLVDITPLSQPRDSSVVNNDVMPQVEIANHELPEATKGNLPSFCVLEDAVDVEGLEDGFHILQREDLQRQKTAVITDKILSVKDMKLNSNIEIERVKQKIKVYSYKLQQQIKKTEEECLRICDEMGRRNNTDFQSYEQTLNKLKTEGDEHKASDNFVIILDEEDNQRGNLPRPRDLQIFSGLNCIQTLKSLFHSFKSFLNSYKFPCYSFHSL